MTTGIPGLSLLQALAHILEVSLVPPTPFFQTWIHHVSSEPFAFLSFTYSLTFSGNHKLTTSLHGSTHSCPRQELAISSYSFQAQFRCANKAFADTAGRVDLFLPCLILLRWQSFTQQHTGRVGLTHPQWPTGSRPLDRHYHHGHLPCGTLDTKYWCHTTGVGSTVTGFHGSLAPDSESCPEMSKWLHLITAALPELRELSICLWHS